MKLGETTMKLRLQRRVFVVQFGQAFTVAWTLMAVKEENKRKDGEKKKKKGKY